MLTRQSILSRLSSVAATVTITALGGEIGIRRLSFADAVALAEAGAKVANDPASQEAFMVQLVLTCACDDKGRKLFKPSDADAVARLPASALQHIADAALSANDLTADAIEDAVGNSATTPGDDGS